MTTSPSLPIIACKELRTFQGTDKPHLIIDVRDTADYEAGHVEGSVHVPFDELETNLPALAHDRKELVIVVGEKPAQAHMTWEHLKKAGFTDVKFLLGGFDEWCKPAAPDIDDVLTEMKEDEEFLGAAKQHGEDVDEVDQENDNQPLM